MVITIKPHDQEPIIDKSSYRVISSVFLAGTIDNGNSEDWQSKYIQEMETLIPEDCLFIIYNPRRDPNKGIDSSDEEEMNYQINWEMEHMEIADFIYMNILPNSKSPISLIELGLFANSKKLKVVCPKEFYRYYNVKFICDRFNIPFKEHAADKWSINT